jgi:Double zinc ribbon
VSIDGGETVGAPGARRALQAPLWGTECQRLPGAGLSMLAPGALSYSPMSETSSSSSGPPTPPCPTCGAPASGRFCSSCGSPLGAIACGACQAELAPGAKFCHVCGTPVAVPGATPAPAAASPTRGDTLPWAVAGIAVLALIAMVAGQHLAQSGSPSGPQAVAAGDAGSAGGAGAGSVPMGPAPDISQMSPEERAQRLYDRMMGWFEAGHMDTVQMFAPMATAAYQMLDTMTLDDRYDLGRIGVISGANVLATAEADTILRQHPNHLLGLILASEAAGARNDTAVERRYLDRLLKAAPAEQAKNLPEYRAHQNDITAALARARTR